MPEERPGAAAPPELLAWRAGLDAAIAGGMFRTDPAPEAAMLGTIPALRFRPDGPSRGIVLHLHGGGFRLGRPEQVAPFASALAVASGMTILCPRYRLAPEHPFPAALNDARAALAGVRAEGARRIVLSGDSAGGGIAAGLAALAARDAVPPAGLVLLSPWLDLAVANPSFAANAGTDPLFSADAARTAAALYLGGGDPAHPLASPALGSVDHYPPTFLNVGAGEVLVDDARRFHDRLADAGVAVRLQVIPGMEHVAVTRGPSLTGSAETFEAIVAFLDALP